MGLCLYVRRQQPTGGNIMARQILTFKADLVLDYLKENATCKELAVTSKKMVTLFNFHDGGEFRRAIHHLRIKGYPIISCNKGYYYSTNSDDIKNMINNLYVRAEGILDIIRVLEDIK